MTNEGTELMTRPAYDIAPAAAKATMDNLQSIMQAVLDDSDYANIKGRKARKRSGFAKLRRVFCISVETLEEGWEPLGDGDFGYRVSVRATFPDGRHEDGDGYCDSIEMAQGNIAPSRHNVRAKAVTRAKNRATADLLGTGEVSAEEYGPDSYGKRKRQPQRNQEPQWEVVDAPISNGHPRPLDAETVRGTIRKKSGWQDGSRFDGEPITEGQIKGVGGLMADAVKVDGMNQKILDKARHDVLYYLIGVTETAALTKREASAIISWLKEDGDGWELNEYARTEAAAVLKALAIEAGQQEMDL